MPTLFLSPSFAPSRCCLSLALVVTVFISSILEGLRRMKFTHSWVELTKKTASYSTALYLWRCEFLMKPEVVLTNSLISFWPTSVPRIRLVALINFIKISKCIPPVYYCGVEEQSNQACFTKTSNFQIDLKTLSSIFCWCDFSQIVAALTVLLPVHLVL